MAKKVWKSQKIYDLLVRIDGGYEPTETEINMLGTVDSLSLSGKPITKLLESINRLTALEYLDLYKTRMPELP